MLREARMRNGPDVVDGFRMRGREVTRLESFSDAIFAFALTLLIVSLEVPKSFADLIDTMRGFPAFAVCFVVLVTIWNTHYKFSHRFGLDDATTRFLTCVLLFIVLFYVYPLKFLFTLGINDMIFGGSDTGPRMSQRELSTLFLFTVLDSPAFISRSPCFTCTPGGCVTSSTYRNSKNLRPVTSFIGCSR